MDENKESSINQLKKFPPKLSKSKPDEVVKYFQQIYPGNIEEENMILITHYILQSLLIECSLWLDLIPFDNRFKKMMKQNYEDLIKNNEYEYALLENEIKNNHAKHSIISKN